MTNHLWQGRTGNECLWASGTARQSRETGLEASPKVVEKAYDGQREIGVALEIRERNLYQADYPILGNPLAREYVRSTECSFTNGSMWPRSGSIMRMPNRVEKCEHRSGSVERWQLCPKTSCRNFAAS